jgi:hypothetical protein
LTVEGCTVIDAGFVDFAVEVQAAAAAIVVSDRERGAAILIAVEELTVALQVAPVVTTCKGCA